jgi:hypothetical protein
MFAPLQVHFVAIFDAARLRYCRNRNGKPRGRQANSWAVGITRMHVSSIKPLGQLILTSSLSDRLPLRQQAIAVDDCAAISLLNWCRPFFASQTVLGGAPTPQGFGQWAFQEHERW